MERLLIWRGLDEWRAEATHVRIDGDRLTAQGTQLGAHPYRLDYRLVTGAGVRGGAARAVAAPRRAASGAS